MSLSEIRAGGVESDAVAASSRWSRYPIQSWKIHVYFEASKSMHILISLEADYNPGGKRCGVLWSSQGAYDPLTPSFLEGSIEIRLPLHMNDSMRRDGVRGSYAP